MRISLSMFGGALVVACLSVPAVALADGDAAKGAKIFKKCAACHTATEAKNKVGPHLVSILDRPVASVEDYKYSNAMIEHANDTATWTTEALTAYLHDPKGVVKGTKMAFAGLKKDEDITDVIAYLVESSPAAAAPAEPAPEEGAAVAPAEEAPAEEAKTEPEMAELGDAKVGAKIFKKCAACHTAEEAKNKVGPHLVDIVDRPIASVEDYKYSKAMVEHATEVPTWTVEALDAYLRSPKGVVKGTKMAFAGLKKDKEVADIIAYLTDPAAAE